MKLIVGLGNPGDKYNDTRHNLGFNLLNHYAEKHLGPKIIWNIEKKFNAETLKIDELLLVKPQTYMNNSGQAVSALANFFKIKPEDLIVVHDELDLPLGKIKVRLGGAAAGHHGVESIINTLGDDKFIRLRLGIGNIKSSSGERKQISFNAEKFVVEPFISSERSKVKHLIKQAIGALDLLIDKGIGVAQNQFN